jgi:hypothetical protein
VKFLLTRTFAFSLLVLSPAARDEELCRGVIPENELSIPVDEGRAMSGGGGITEIQFNEILDRIQAAYGDSSNRIHVSRNWTSPEVNAYASVQKPDGRRVVSFLGGLARHPAIDADAFLLVACHEVGHHLGGIPRRTGLTRDKWASIEGQADYFATLKCVHKVWAWDDNRAALVGRTIHPLVESECRHQFRGDREIDLCVRASLAGESLARFFAEVGKAAAPDFDHTDGKVVEAIFEGHPAPQCRLDTYFQGSLCTADPSIPLSGSDAYAGACSTEQGHDRGLRATCWFKH